MVVKMKYSLTLISGVLYIINFIIFVIISALFLPKYPVSISIYRTIVFPFSVLSNFLSDLGNYFYNPQGAIFFNIMLIINGILLILFFYNFPIIPSIMKYTNNSFVINIVKILGISCGILTTLLGIYPDSNPIIHSILSYVFFLFVINTFILISIIIVNHPLYLFLLDIFAIFMGSLFIFGIIRNLFIMEWIVLGCFLCYYAIIVYVIQEYSEKVKFIIHF